MRVLIWATSLQADLLALALYLDAHDEHQLLIAATAKEVYVSQPIAQKRPFQSHLIDRLADDVEGIIGAFAPEVTVVDNHFQRFTTSPALCKMWYGLGWKAPDKKSMTVYFEDVLRLTGHSPDEENPHFIAQCYGPHDMDWRIDKMNIHESNCRIVGMPFSDLLLNPPYTKAEVAQHYTIDVLKRKTVLVNFTWHHGSANAPTTAQAGMQENAKDSWWSRMFSQGNLDKDDALFLRRMVEAVLSENANVLFCMHDKWRYDYEYLALFYQLRAEYPDRVEVKHKDESPDNLMDLLVADVMVSNLSSFITFFYLTGKPTVHLVPRKSSAQKKATETRIRTEESNHAADQYMTDPDDNGGITVYSRRECIRAIIRALHEPDCCRVRAQRFIAQKTPDFVGESCAAYIEALEALVAQQG